MPFAPPTQAQVIARCLSDFRAEAGLNPLRRSIERALCVALAGQSKGLYTYQDFIFRQCFPTTAEEQYFWRWAAVWDITQKPGTEWQGTVKLTGVDTTVVPDGTPMTRSDGAEYETVGAATIGSTTTGEVDVLVRSVETGEDKNLDDGDPLTVTSAIPDVDTDAVVVVTTQTAEDLEEPADGLTRLLQRISQPPSGGVAGDYVRWALEVAGVTRAWEESNAPGTVTVSFVRDDDGSGAAILPDGTERTEVETYVQSKAPLTVEVDVATLTALNVPVQISDLVPDTTDVRNAIDAAIEDFFFQEAAPGTDGTIFLSRLREAISAAAGESSHTLDLPAADVVPSATQVPIYTGLTVV
jgi:uncharacterized phage protein gp47/JayE